jgi:DNA-directed RNA polymerase subunit alpha
MNQQPTFHIKEEETKNDYGRFSIEPLEQGYGQTLGTSLRRVLLSSLQGAAVTQVTVSGLKHQFGTVKGVKEDGIDLLLNIKKLRVKYNGDKPARMTLEATGEGPVTASQIKTPSDIEIANPELVIANLSDGKTKLSVEMTVETGVGYSLAAERKLNKIGVMPIDADFSPVKRVNVKVEETRVGRLTNFDKLSLEVWTDGTMEPLAAVQTSAEILVGYLQRVVSPVTTQTGGAAAVVSTPVSGSKSESLSVEELGLPTRIANALSKAGFETVSDLRGRKKELAKIRNLGEKSIKVIEAGLNEKGITWEE